MGIVTLDPTLRGEVQTSERILPEMHSGNRP